MWTVEDRGEGGQELEGEFQSEGMSTLQLFELLREFEVYLQDDNTEVREWEWEVGDKDRRVQQVQFVDKGHDCCGDDRRVRILVSSDFQVRGALGE